MFVGEFRCHANGKSYIKIIKLFNMFPKDQFATVNETMFFKIVPDIFQQVTEGRKLQK